MKRVRGSRRGQGIAAIALLGVVASVQTVVADVFPPVKITMPVDTPVAVRGHLFTGEFQIQIGEAGFIENVSVDAQGWRLVDVDTSRVGAVTAGEVVSVPFQMIAGDPDELLTLSFTHNGRRVAKSLRVGPAGLARRGRDLPVVQIEPGQADRSRVTAGDAITLHFTGRLVYDRPVALDGDGNPTGGTIPVGVDRMWVEIIDDDDLSTETVWAGYTDRNGYFDTGDFQWDDCDISGCDDPDLFIRWECDNDIVNVQDANDILEEDWSWSTEADTLNDFTGSFHDFGTLKPTDSGQMPILHIHNSIVRAHRWIAQKSGSGIDLDHVDVQWPEPEGGSGAYYVYIFEEIYIAPSREWQEATHTHEYGHHFIFNHANLEESDYCNGICDTEDDCSHCLWCEENPSDAWSEGWPDWFGDVVTRDYPDSYTFSDGTPYTALKGRSLETIQKCTEGASEDFDDPLMTEGFLGALLRDIEDVSPDAEEPVAGDGFEVTERRDCLQLGSDEIFAITTEYEPITPAGFLSTFLLVYPELTPRLYVTAVGLQTSFPGQGQFTDLFFPDTQLPGVVEEVRSATHPIGQGGPSPCIVLSWDTPPDDVQGAQVYSVVWGTDPAGQEPDLKLDVSASCVDVAMEAVGLGSYYLSVKARGWSDNEWSNDWGVFGPFTVTDCNSNGVVDLCEVSCNPSSVYDDLACTVNSAFCSAQSACGTAQDCNDNKIPDGCDVAGGQSEDCNQNGVPDECESIFHWKNGTGAWNTATNWVEENLVANGSSVCIQDPDEQATVTIPTGATTVAVLACDENLTVSRGANLSASHLTLNEPSWVRGNLTLAGSDTRLTVNNRLDIDGLFTWNNGTDLAGAGTTYARGGVLLPGGIANLENNDLVLESGTTNISRGRIDFPGSSSTLIIRPGAVFDHQSASGVVNGGSTTTLFRNEGTFIKSVSTAAVGINSRVENAGLMHVQAGTLAIFNNTSDNTGAFLADPGTVLQFTGGGNEFQPSSSITAERVQFLTGRTAPNFFRGTYDVSVSTLVQNVLTFENGSNIINYGPTFSVSGGVTFNAVAGRTIHFDSISGGMIHFNSGDPIVAEIMTVSGGTGLLDGPSPITVNGSLTYGGGATIRGPGLLNINGTMVVTASSSSKFFSNRTLNNAGTVTSNGGFEAQGTTMLNNLAGAVWDVRGDTGIVLGGAATPFNNEGLLVKTAGIGASRISAMFRNTGTVESRIGAIEFRHPFVQTAGEMLLNGGNIGTYGSPLPAAPRMDGGRLRGNGSIGVGLNNVGGVVEPGFSAGGITVNGAYTQGAGGTLSIEIGGLTPITEFDQLNVSGAATLHGNLEVEFINSFTPVVGDSFTVVVGGSRSGVFDDFTYEGLPSHLVLALNTTVNTIHLDVFERFPPDGDCNFSESINLADFETLHGCYAGPALTTPAPPIASACRCADMDLDDDVDLHDAARFQNQFNGGF